MMKYNFDAYWLWECCRIAQKAVKALCISKLLPIKLQFRQSSRKKEDEDAVWPELA